MWDTFFLALAIGFVWLVGDYIISLLTKKLKPGVLAKFIRERLVH